MRESVTLPLHCCKDLTKIIEKFIELCGDNVKKIILFGSFATSKYQPDSDYDICVILEKLPLSNSDRLGLRNIAEQCGIDRDVDVVLGSQADLETANMVFKYIRRDGILLYG